MKYTVWGHYLGDCYCEVEADSPDEAWRKAKEKGFTRCLADNFSLNYIDYCDVVEEVNE